MEIIESWGDHNANSYIIVRHSKEDQKEYREKLETQLGVDDELHSFGGTVGYTAAYFNALVEGQEIWLRCIALEDIVSDI